MRKGKLIRVCNRTLAVFMAIALMFSSFQGMTITAHAQENAAEITLPEEENGETAQNAEDDITGEMPEPAEDQQEPAENQQEPAEEPQEPAEEQQEPAEDQQEPAEDQQEPAEDQQEPAEDQQEPAEEPQEPAEEPQEPAEESQEPAEDLQETEASAEEEQPEADEAVDMQLQAGDALYTGEYDEETGTVSLSVAAIEEIYGKFDDETLLTVLGGISVPYCRAIELFSNTMQTAISQDVWNAMVLLLTEDNNVIKLFVLDETADAIWTFSNPDQVQSEVSITYTMSINGSRKGIALNFDNTTFSADDAMLELYVDSSKTGYEELENSFWSNQAAEIRNEDGSVLEGAIVNYNVNNEEERIQLEVGVYNQENAYQLSAQTAYTIVTPFKGLVWGEEVTGLDLFPGMVAEESFTRDEIEGILAEYNGRTFDEFYVEYPYAETISVAADVVNLLVENLKWTEDVEQYVKFGYTDYETGNSKEIRLLNPKGEENDKTVSANLTFAADNTVSVDALGFTFDADRTDVWFNYPENSQEAAALKNMFGENSKDLLVGDSEAWACYGQNDGIVYLQIFGVNALAEGTSYVVKEDIYHGDVQDTEEGHVLYIQPYEFNQEAFAAGDLQKYFNSYLQGIESGEQAAFNKIMVEQRYAGGNNIIRKEDINFLRKLLVEDDGYSVRNIEYIFNRSTYDEQADEYYSDDVVWIIQNPGKAERNINANCTYSIVPGQGFSLKLKNNTYKASGIFLEFRFNNNTEEGRALENVFEEYSGELGIFNKASFSKIDTVYADLWKDEEGTTAGIWIPDVDSYEADTEYMFTPIHDMSCYEDPDFDFYIGDDAGNITKLETTRVPDANTQVTWKSFDPIKLSIAADGSSVQALNEGTVYYAASYQSEGIQAVDVFKRNINIKINSIAFDKDSMTMILPGEGEDWENEQYLRVKFYPASAAIAQIDMDWQVEMLEGEDVVELVEMHVILEWLDDGSVIAEWRNPGGVIARNPGVAKVTATVPGTDISASCIITVTKPLEVPENAWPNAWAITNVDQTLETVELQMQEGAEGSWRWKDPSESLESFENMTYHDFDAIYTLPDGREITCKVGVNMVNIAELRIFGQEMNESGTEWYEVDPYRFLEKGTSMVLYYDYIWNNDGYDIIDRYIENGRLSVEWSTNPAGIGTTQGVEEEGYLPGSYKVTADEQSGEKTITVSIKETQTGRVVISESHVVTVPASSITAWEQLEIDWIPKNENIVGVAGEKGTLVFRLPKDGYYPLTITSLDTGICKLGKKATVDKTSEEGYVLTKISYEILSEGMIFISVKSADEVKSNIRFDRRILDIAPKYTGEVLAINKQWEDKSDELVIQMTPGAEVTAAADELTLSGAGAQNFAINDIIDNGNGTVLLQIALINSAAANKTYSLNVNNFGVAFDNGEEAASDTFRMSFKVKVSNTKPSVTFGQSNALNLFYTDDEGYASLTIKAGDAIVTDVVLGDYVDKKPKNNKVCDYELVQTDIGDYIIKPKDGKKGSNKKGTLTYRVEGYEGVYSKTFTVKAENEAPVITLSANSDVLYPYVADIDTMVTLTDKKTKEPIEIYKLQWIKNARKKIYVDIPYRGTWSGEDAAVIQGKNSYYAEYWNDTISFSIQSGELAAKKDSVQMQVWEENWSKPVKITYDMTVKFNKPSLELGKKTVTLNVNEGIYEYQRAGTELKLKNASENLKNVGIYFVGANDKSKAVLNKNLVLEYEDYSGMIWCRFNAKNAQDRPAAGTYTYNVYMADAFGGPIKTSLKVKVIDEPIEECLEVNKKGSIDVLDREGTVITYKPNISNLTGRVIDAYLVGKDADMFDWYWENNKLLVKAKEGMAYSTAYTYKVKPVFCIENIDWDYYEITGKEQSIRLKQGKTQVKVSAPKNILYRDKGNELEIGFTAMLNNKKKVVIDNVELLNYTSDFRLKDWEMEDYDGNVYFTQFNPETETVTLSQEWITKVVAKNKETKLKFAVYYRDRAGNVKATQVTYKVVVK